MIEPAPSPNALFWGYFGLNLLNVRAGKMSKAADIVEQTVHEMLTYYAFLDIHWQKIRINNP